VLVVERIHGVPIGEIDRLKASGTDMALLAERGVEVFFTQVFRHNFFHADIHPGNIFVDISDPNSTSYIAVDCAIVGSLTESDQEYLARNLVAFFHRDYREVAVQHRRSGWIREDVDLEDFEGVIRQLCEPLFEKPLEEISFSQFLVALFSAARRFKMEVQPQLVLLQKTLINIEGLGRQIYPELNLWQTAKPFMENWLEERLGFPALLRGLANRMPQVLERLPELVSGDDNRMAKLENTIDMQQQQLAKMHRMLTGIRRASVGLVMLVLLLLSGGIYLAGRWFAGS